MSPLAIKGKNPTDRHIMMCQQYKRCHFCNRLLDSYAHAMASYNNGYTATVEHMIPRSRGGSRLIDNKVMSCSRCNDLRNQIEMRLEGHGRWETIDVPAELFIDLLPVDIFHWHLTDPKKLGRVVDDMRWGRASL
jgi:hypothetical protein